MVSPNNEKPIYTTKELDFFVSLTIGLTTVMQLLIESRFLEASIASCLIPCSYILVRSTRFIVESVLIMFMGRIE